MLLHRFFNTVTNRKEYNSTLKLTDASNKVIGLKASAIDTEYELTLPIKDGTAGQILTTNGSGQLRWENKTNVDITDYSFTSNGSGETNFDTTVALTSQKIIVTENGVTKREGASYDWTRSGTEVIFNYPVINTWVNVTVYGIVSLSDFHFDVSNSGQTEFVCEVDLTGKRVLVYENGALKREGASFDYTSAGSTVTMNYLVKNAWVLILVYV
jgi:hypothetical protein